MRAPPNGTARDQSWFERKVAELRGELDKLPPERAAEVIRELDKEEERAN
jgi:hypothetical protein